VNATGGDGGYSGGQCGRRWHAWVHKDSQLRTVTCLAEVDTSTDLNQFILNHHPCMIQITLFVFHVS
jgi:hypothetical protein